MARLIVKSPYLKCGGSNSVSGYLRYIGTRERVELLPDDRPPTRKQEQLITKLVKDFPDAQKLDEYSDYKVKPTKANASAFITRALEENWSAVQQSDGYMKYIATRPRTERLGNHGLFGDEENADLEKAMDELDRCTGNVWTHIISLKREDATRLGYRNTTTKFGQRLGKGTSRHHEKSKPDVTVPPQILRRCKQEEGPLEKGRPFKWSKLRTVCGISVVKTKTPIFDNTFRRKK